MAKVLLGWKVVRVTLSGELLAASSWPSDSSYRAVRYKLNRWTHPEARCGPLAVFKTRKHARDFVRKLPEWCIYCCKYIPSVETKQWTPGVTLFPDEMPIGKALATKVMLLKKVR
jgi:hypothetical protein